MLQVCRYRSAEPLGYILQRKGEVWPLFSDCGLQNHAFSQVKDSSLVIISSSHMHMNSWSALALAGRLQGRSSCRLVLTYCGSPFLQQGPWAGGAACALNV